MKYLIILIFIFSTGYTFSQDYLINAVNGQTINTCSGNFYDSGGFAPNC